MADLDKPNNHIQGTEGLLHSLRDLIQGARQRVLRAIDPVQVHTCWKLAAISWNLSRAVRHVPNTARGFCRFWLSH